MPALLLRDVADNYAGVAMLIRDVDYLFFHDAFALAARCLLRHATPLVAAIADAITLPLLMLYASARHMLRAA